MNQQALESIKAVADSLRPDLPQHSATLDWALTQLQIERAELQRRLDNADYLIRAAVARETVGQP